MRKRKNTAFRLSSGKVPTPPVDTVSTDELLYGSPHSAEWVDFLLKVLSGVLVPTIVAAVTLFAAAWQFNVANDRADRARFIDGALATAQETSILLDESQNALDKLLNATENYGWTSFSEGPFRDYIYFHQHWRQRAIAEHFKLTRYFGKDVADQLIYIDEIDLRPSKSVGVSSPCVLTGGGKESDFEKMNFQASCEITQIPILQDIINDKRLAKTENEMFETFRARGEQGEFARKLLSRYEKVKVVYLRQLNATLTQLGQPQVTVVPKSSPEGR
jgi:hypothetical protein